MHLSKDLVSHLKGPDIPEQPFFHLPEKVLQFGTGVLLRGLPDYYIDKANKQGIFNGRILVVKSTDTGESEAFSRQDGLYTHCIRGMVNGIKMEENILNASISRVLVAKSEWEKVLESASNPDLAIIISNTTEVGIQLQQDSIRDTPPRSFPGKLLAFLYRRYQVCKGEPSGGFIIIPTELIVDNATLLLNILEELSSQNGLERDFVQWMKNANHFCNSLVDRIVPGKLPISQQEVLERELGYTDELMIMSEVYGLWAIEASNEKVKEALSFSQVDPGVVIAPDIEEYRQLKLRLLNGPHTFCCGLAFLAGFHTVKEAMQNKIFEGFINKLMREEIAPAIEGEKITGVQAREFAAKVMDRFRNPYLEHQWLSITLQYSSKMCLRNVPLMRSCFHRFGKVPPGMVLGFAAYLRFMKSSLTEEGSYCGEWLGKKYLIKDDKADYYSELWAKYPPGQLIDKVLNNEKLWNCDLAELDGFADAVLVQLNQLLKIESAAGVLELMKGLQGG